MTGMMQLLASFQTDKGLCKSPGALNLLLSKAHSSDVTNMHSGILLNAGPDVLTLDIGHMEGIPDAIACRLQDWQRPGQVPWCAGSALGQYVLGCCLAAPLMTDSPGGRHCPTPGY